MPDRAYSVTGVLRRARIIYWLHPWPQMNNITEHSTSKLIAMADHYTIPKALLEVHYLKLSKLIILICKITIYYTILVLWNIP